MTDQDEEYTQDTSQEQTNTGGPEIPKTPETPKIGERVRNFFGGNKREKNPKQETPQPQEAPKQEQPKPRKYKDIWSMYETDAYDENVPWQKEVKERMQADPEFKERWGKFNGWFSSGIKAAPRGQSAYINKFDESRGEEEKNWRRYKKAYGLSQDDDIDFGTDDNDRPIADEKGFRDLFEYTKDPTVVFGGDFGRDGFNDFWDTRGRYNKFNTTPYSVYADNPTYNNWYWSRNPFRLFKYKSSTRADATDDDRRMGDLSELMNGNRWGGGSDRSARLTNRGEFDDISANLYQAKRVRDIFGDEEDPDFFKFMDTIRDSEDPKDRALYDLYWRRGTPGMPSEKDYDRLKEDYYHYREQQHGIGRDGKPINPQQEQPQPQPGPTQEQSQAKEVGGPTGDVSATVDGKPVNAEIVTENNKLPATGREGVQDTPQDVTQYKEPKETYIEPDDHPGPYTGEPTSLEGPEPPKKDSVIEDKSGTTYDTMRNPDLLARHMEHALTGVAQAAAEMGGQMVSKGWDLASDIVRMTFTQPHAMSSTSRMIGTAMGSLEMAGDFADRAAQKYGINLQQDPELMKDTIKYKLYKREAQQANGVVGNTFRAIAGSLDKMGVQDISQMTPDQLSQHVADMRQEAARLNNIIAQDKANTQFGKRQNRLSSQDRALVYAQAKHLQSYLDQLSRQGATMAADQRAMARQQRQASRQQRLQAQSTLANGQANPYQQILQWADPNANWEIDGNTGMPTRTGAYNDMLRTLRDRREQERMANNGVLDPAREQWFNQMDQDLTRRRDDVQREARHAPLRKYGNVFVGMSDHAPGIGQHIDRILRFGIWPSTVPVKSIRDYLSNIVSKGAAHGASAAEINHAQALLLSLDMHTRSRSLVSKISHISPKRAAYAMRYHIQAKDRWATTRLDAVEAKNDEVRLAAAYRKLNAALPKDFATAQNFNPNDPTFQQALHEYERELIKYENKWFPGMSGNRQRGTAQSGQAGPGQSGPGASGQQNSQGIPQQGTSQGIPQQGIPQQGAAQQGPPQGTQQGNQNQNQNSQNNQNNQNQNTNGTGNPAGSNNNNNTRGRRRTGGGGKGGNGGAATPPPTGRKRTARFNKLFKSKSAARRFASRFLDDYERIKDEATYNYIRDRVAAQGIDPALFDEKFEGFKPLSMLPVGERVQIKMGYIYEDGKPTNKVLRRMFRLYPGSDELMDKYIDGTINEEESEKLRNILIDMGLKPPETADTSTSDSSSGTQDANSNQQASQNQQNTPNQQIPQDGSNAPPNDSNGGVDQEGTGDVDERAQYIKDNRESFRGNVPDPEQELVNTMSDPDASASKMKELEDLADRFDMDEITPDNIGTMWRRTRDPQDLNKAIDIVLAKAAAEGGPDALHDAQERILDSLSGAEYEKSIEDQKDRADLQSGAITQEEIDRRNDAAYKEVLNNAERRQAIRYWNRDVAGFRDDLRAHPELLDKYGLEIQGDQLVPKGTVPPQGEGIDEANPDAEFEEDEEYDEEQDEAVQQLKDEIGIIPQGKTLRQFADDVIRSINNKAEKITDHITYNAKNRDDRIRKGVRRWVDRIIRQKSTLGTAMNGKKKIRVVTESDEDFAARKNRIAEGLSAYIIDTLGYDRKAFSNVEQESESDIKLKARVNDARGKNYAGTTTAKESRFKDIRKVMFINSDEADKDYALTFSDMVDAAPPEVQKEYDDFLNNYLQDKGADYFKDGWRFKTIQTYINEVRGGAWPDEDPAKKKRMDLPKLTNGADLSSFRKFRREINEGEEVTREEIGSIMRDLVTLRSFYSQKLASAGTDAEKKAISTQMKGVEDEIMAWGYIWNPQLKDTDTSMREKYRDAVRAYYLDDDMKNVLKTGDKDTIDAYLEERGKKLPPEYRGILREEASTLRAQLKLEEEMANAPEYTDVDLTTDDKRSILDVVNDLETVLNNGEKVDPDVFDTVKRMIDSHFTKHSLTGDNALDQKTGLMERVSRAKAKYFGKAPETEEEPSEETPRESPIQRINRAIQILTDAKNNSIVNEDLLRRIVASARNDLIDRYGSDQQIYVDAQNRLKGLFPAEAGQYGDSQRETGYDQELKDIISNIQIKYSDNPTTRDELIKQAIETYNQKKEQEVRRKQDVADGIGPALDDLEQIISRQEELKPGTLAELERIIKGSILSPEDKNAALQRFNSLKTEYRKYKPVTEWKSPEPTKKKTPQEISQESRARYEQSINSGTADLRKLAMDFEHDNTLLPEDRQAIQNMLTPPKGAGESIDEMDVGGEEPVHNAPENPNTDRSAIDRRILSNKLYDMNLNETDDLTVEDAVQGILNRDWSYLVNLIKNTRDKDDLNDQITAMNELFKIAGLGQKQRDAIFGEINSDPKIANLLYKSFRDIMRERNPDWE